MSLRRMIPFLLPWKKALPSICSKCRQQKIYLALESHLYSTKTGSMSKKNERKRIIVENLTPKIVITKSNSKETDWMRPVSDKLLRSLKKRHGFSVVKIGATLPNNKKDFQDMSVEDLIGAISKDPQERTQGVYFQAIEGELVKRLYGMTGSMMLQVCHSFYTQGIPFNYFLSQMLTVIDELFDYLSLSPEELSKLFLYIFIHGGAPAMLFHHCEEYLSANLEKFHINDLGVICVGFFRGNSRISSQSFLDKLAGKLLQDLELLEPFLLLDFMKVFRHSSYIRSSFYNKLGDKLVQINFLSNYNFVNPLMHIAFMYASIPVKHEGLFNSLFCRFEQLLAKQKKIRSKDISKFIWACGTLQFTPPNGGDGFAPFVEYFERHSRSNEFPESLAEFVVGLIYVGVFPRQLLERCLSESVTKALMKRSADKEKSMQLLMLNETARIECSSRNIISQAMIEKLQRQPSASVDLEKELLTRTGLSTVLSTLQHCLGEDKVNFGNPLIHFKTPVIELLHSSNNGFLRFSGTPERKQMSGKNYNQRNISDGLMSALSMHKVFESSSSQECQNVVHDSPVRLAVVVSSKGQYALNDSGHVLGHLRTMLRQMEKLGYTVLHISPAEALELQLTSQEHRHQILSQRLSSVLNTSITLPCV